MQNQINNIYIEATSTRRPNHQKLASAGKTQFMTTDTKHRQTSSSLSPFTSFFFPHLHLPLPLIPPTHSGSSLVPFTLFISYTCCLVISFFYCFHAYLLPSLSFSSFPFSLTFILFPIQLFTTSFHFPTPSASCHNLSFFSSHVSSFFSFILA